VGRALVAIRDHPVAAQAMGVNTALYKSLTFGVSALYTGIAGALASIAVQFASPDSFGIFLSLTLLIGIVVGGLASISGAFYGALFVQFVPNIADQISKAAPWAIYGVFLIAFMYLMPSGVAGLIAMMRRRLVPLPLMERKQDVHESTQDPGDRRGDVGRALPEHGVRPGEKGSEARPNHAL
jgi:branched-chain amino acid transport system permease protein